MLGGRALRLGQARGPSAAARQARGLAVRPHDQFYKIYTFDRKGEGGGSKIVLKEITKKYFRFLN